MAPSSQRRRRSRRNGGGGIFDTYAQSFEEVKEETGLDVEITGLVGAYTDPRHVIAYADGEVRRQFNVCFTARVAGGQLAISDESTELRSSRQPAVGSRQSAVGAGAMPVGHDPSSSPTEHLA
ncbi:hypothetical protein OHS81_12710 [Streptomyces sp. NBC_00400]